MSAFKTRVAELLRKEARCPACAKAKRRAEGKTFAPICENHQRIRRELAFN